MSWGVLALGLMLATACSSGDAKLERRGGPLPNGDGGATDNGGASTGDGPVAFCDALTVVRAKCQRCHTMPPQNGAPVPFLAYDDFNTPYGDGSTTYGKVCGADRGRRRHALRDAE